MNKTILLGRLVKDPDVRVTTNAKTVASFTLAVNRRFAKKDEDDADFFNIVAWSQLGEFCGKYFTKGQQVVVVGRLQNRSWDKDGQKHYVTEIIAEEAYFADSKKSDNSGSFFPGE